MQYSLIISTPKNIYFVLCFSLTCSTNSDDYWRADFDLDKDCKLEYRINRLSAMEPSPCESVLITEGEQKAFTDCKIKLSNNLQKFCDVRDEATWQFLGGRFEVKFDNIK